MGRPRGFLLGSQEEPPEEVLTEELNAVRALVERFASRRRWNFRGRRSAPEADRLHGRQDATPPRLGGGGWVPDRFQTRLDLDSGVERV